MNFIVLSLSNLHEEFFRTSVQAEKDLFLKGLQRWQLFFSFHSILIPWILMIMELKNQLCQFTQGGLALLGLGMFMFWQIPAARPLSSASLTYLLLFRIEKQICSFIFWEKFRHDNFVSRSTDLYHSWHWNLVSLISF